MSSPNEPGYPRTGDGPTSNSGPATGGGGGAHAAPTGETPPWQRDRAAATGEAAAAGQSLNDRLNRFVSGGGSAGGSALDAETTITPAVPPTPPTPPVITGTAGPQQPRVDRTETIRTETRPDPRSDAYASEIPDLSRQAPRRSVEPREPRATVSPAAAAPARTTVPRSRAAARQEGPVRASMQVRRVDPWSVLKVSLVLSVALFFVWMIAVAFLYLVLGGMGVWSKLNSNVGDLLTSGGGSGGELVSAGTIFGGATLIGLVNIVLLTAMATTAAFVYNLTTDLVGGIEVTLADRD
ncbi:MAG: DUF3566 domain-containing protein [Mycobacterium sp.]|nr:DUF3566 domain-containing protein [Mycobacterium sp.]